jgi:membrane fusion protein, heavy metal efflux system
MKYFISICICCAVVQACQNITSKESSLQPVFDSDSIVTINNPSIINRIKTLRINPEKYQKKIITSGTVEAIPNNYAEIASPFAGRITRSFVILGQKVDIDSPVFEISSPAFYEAGKTYYQTKQEMQLAEKSLKRQQDLYNNGVGSQKDLDESEVNYELSRRDYENSIASLRVYHVDPDKLILGQPLIVRSPIKGEIVENNIVIGQYLKEEAEPVAIVAELSNIWVIGQLKEKDIEMVHESDSVEIRLSGVANKPLKGNVFHIGEILDKETRSVKIFILCKNNNRVLKPGMFVTTQFYDDSDKTILVPSNSIFQIGDKSYVFKSAGNGVFIKQVVETDGTDNNRIIIKSGLKANDEIVTEDGILLTDIK